QDMDSLPAEDVPAVNAPAGEAAPVEEPEAQAESAEDEEAPRGRRGRRERQPRQGRREAAPRGDRPERQDKADDADMESALPRVPLAELDQEKLIESTRTVISRLVAPVLDMEPEEVTLSVEVGEDRMQVSVKSEDTGLLIGRDGQNLAAVQYLATRMITRIIGSQVRVQVDAGDYHVRQDTRLQELALSLAEKVKATGKVQTTRPLSAYQRRVIHLALQDDPDVQTRSSGEGALKHVVILKRKD
ncbi:Jag family protein, partial [Mailhella sp.]|uniref:Jag family protein n=1 Tax=Mailhella sp. TaxID=1981029 RepID=UPI00406487F7